MKIKVCGMRDESNIAAIAMLKPDLMGFIFYPPSQRFVQDIDPELISILKPITDTVAVFVNEEINKVIETMSRYKFSFVQLHGNEPVEYCFKIKEAGIKIIKVFSVSSEADIDQTSSYSDCCEYFLFDTKSPKHGGTGVKFDWEILNKYQGNTPVILSGGIGPEDTNQIKSVISKFPFIAGIDLNSKFEISPGIKDEALLSEFIESLR